MRSKSRETVKKTPLYNLLKKNPWIVPFSLLIYRITGLYREFVDNYIKPHSRDSEFIEMEE